MNHNARGGVIAGMFWMTGISILLFWLPMIGPFVAGLVGGKKAGSLGAAVGAVFLPSLLAALLIVIMFSTIAGWPIFGAVAGIGVFALSVIHIGPLLVGAVIGGAVLAPTAVSGPQPILLSMWSSTLMVVLTALSAALYAAVLIPFKILPIIPGVTEIRPANAVPIVCSLLFGPAGAFGAAFGNTFGDLFFGLGPGTFFGFIGNFLYGFVPYVFWRAFFGTADPDRSKLTHWVALVFICLVASAACAYTIAWGIDVVIKGVPFAILGTIIFFNNFLMAVLLAPPLLFALQPRVRRWNLHYTQVMDAADTARPRGALLGVVLMTVSALGGLGGGLAIATGAYDQPLGIPWVLKAMGMNKAALPSAPAISATPSVPSAPAASAAKVASLAPASATTSAVGAPAPRPPRTGLGLGLLPALALTALSLFLL